ncbi:hypothetical protein [Cohnella massiliensis]|uniref:hypothetical protein n=1 Tax=Cohnella massiliensis TaxID=1816691 RepID=UPI0009BABD56|nr:hypothetical protein [Cohnella massiliensis]
MLHIRSNTLPADTFEYYNLPKKCPDGINTLEEIADFVFEECSEFIPEGLFWFFSDSEDDFFKYDLVNHIIINAYMGYLLEKDEYVQDRNGLLKIVDSVNFENLIMDEKRGFFRNAARQFEKIGAYFDLPKLENKYRIPRFLSGFLGFSIFYKDIHNILKKEKIENNLYSYKFISEHITTKYFHVYFYNNFCRVLELHTEFTLFNRLLFEREYNFALASEIAILSTQFSDFPDLLDEYEKLLSLAALLPNIIGRLHYIKSIAFSEEIIQQSLSGRIDTTRKWINDLIELALIVIPLMESYFLYLIKNSSVDLDEEWLSTVFHSYESKFFSNEVYEEENNILGSIMDKKWRIAKVPFKKIKRVLQRINKATSLQTLEYQQAFLNPLDFLRRKGADKYTLLAMQISQRYEISRTFLADYMKA